MTDSTNIKMTTADQLAIVNQTLGSEEKALVLADGGLVKDWMKSRRLVVIVAHQGGQTHALFVYNVKTIPVTEAKDLSVDLVVPIDSHFKCDIDSGESALYIKVSSANKVKLMFEMLPGYHTQNFVSEIFRLTDLGSSSGPKDAKASEFAWSNKYAAPSDKGAETNLAAQFDTLGVEPCMKATTSMTSLGGHSDNQESPDASLNRQEIAMGVSPIAARESIVKYQMSMKEEQFTEIQYFTVYTATWNVNGQSPDGSVVEWLSSDPEPPDLYAIGFQELDLSKEAFVFNESPKEDEWQKVVYASLHPKAKYKKVKLIRLVGMMLLVYVKDSHVQYISNIDAENVGTGIMGKLGNKGGVAVRFDFHNTSICFVNSHLAAHVSEYERRNQDYHDICVRMQFQRFVQVKRIEDHDMIYWLGDLNYRITELEATEVKEIIREGKLKELLGSDQFLQQRHLRKVFTGYKEGEVTFNPTYKFDPGTDDWDSSEKARAPAWTDRILWKGDHVEQTCYRSHMELKVSDHKPVSAVFTSGIKVVDQPKYRKIYEDVMKKLDKLENEFLPQVTVETTEVNFDTVKFIEMLSQSLTVANTGQVPVHFEFIKKLNDKSICKPWLSVEPSTGSIMPGDKTDVSIQVYVDKKTAGALNSGQDQLYDILVLHLIGGKDIFVTVSGTYQRSSFGASIEALCRMTVPIGDLSAGAILALEGVTKSDSSSCQVDGGDMVDEEPYPVPKELWFLCDLITSLGLHQEQLFLQPGLRAEMITLRDWLDTGLPVNKPEVSIHSAAETLLLFLESLREPVVPFSIYSQCLECAGNYLQCRQLVSQLPTRHRQVFNYVCEFLREILRFSSQNNIDPKIMATLFASIVLRDPPGTNLGSGIRARTNQQLLDHKKARFLYHFLVNDPNE